MCVPVTFAYVPFSQCIGTCEPVGQNAPTGQVLPVMPSRGFGMDAFRMQYEPAAHWFVTAVLPVPLQ